MKRILFVQHGDYIDSYRRFAAGAAETYRDQERSVAFVAGLPATEPETRVTVLSFGDVAQCTELAPGLQGRVVRRDRWTRRRIRALFAELDPSHVILRTPMVDVLREANRHGAWVLPDFADIFAPGGPRTRLRNRLLARALRAARAPCIANHSLNASRSMVSVLGLPPERIVPWDWNRVPSGGPAKTGPATPGRITLFFAGGLSEAKGVGDCLDAVALLNAQGHGATMTFAGGGDLETWRQQAARHGVGQSVTFAGMLPNAEVRARMRDSDIVLVPSRHSYPEGLPNTIYEGLASRSALIVSDHPAFAGRLREGEDCLVFPAGDATALAACIARLATNPDLYARLSRNAAAAHDRLYVGIDWVALVTAFLRDPANATGWTQGYTLDRYLDADTVS